MVSSKNNRVLEVLVSYRKRIISDKKLKCSKNFLKFKIIKL